MKRVKVIYKNEEYNFITLINGSKEQIRDYYLNSFSNFGTDEREDWQQCIAVEFLD